MIDLFVRTINKYRENEANTMTIKNHIQNLSYIMDSMPDDACGDWRDSLAYAIENLQQKINNGDIIDQIKKEFINLYPKNYMGGLELDGKFCEFSLNKVLEILDKYKKEI